jgi:heterodisulfide reductase subunit C
MTLQIRRKTGARGIRAAVEEASGVSMNACYQCLKCTAGCPVAPHTTTPPSEIVRRLQLGAGEELLESEMIWLCLSCEICYARCPMGINVCAVMDSLKALARERGAAVPKGNMPLFNRLFLDKVKKHGRSYDLGMIVNYKLKTRKLSQDAEKLPAMLRKHKIAILPPSGGDKGRAKRIFGAAQKTGEASK